MDSLTHQQMYYTWVERAWRGGQRVMVNDPVTNNVLCCLPLQVNKTLRRDDVDPPADRGDQEARAVHRQAVRRHGQGLVPDRLLASEARTYVIQGKLAVILGVETSDRSAARQTWASRCAARRTSTPGLDELYGLGVRSMFLCHKFDNALCGVRFDEGTEG